MAGPFKVGDIITGTPEADEIYSITIQAALMRVVNILDEDNIDVEVMTHRSSSKYVNGDALKVNPKYFELVKTTEVAPTFKKGDWVRNIHTGKTSIVQSVPGMEEYDKLPLLNPEIGMILEPNAWVKRKNYELQVEMTIAATVAAKGMGAWSLDNE